MSPRSRSILIVGGGIGGLTAAIALRQAGHTVELVEIRPDWTVAGWGLSLTGPALRALDTLGVADACIATGYGISEIANADRDGTVLDIVQLPPLLGADRPAQAGLSRPDLARILREAASSAGAQLRTGLTVTAIDSSVDGVTATLSDASVRHIDAVLAADGVSSRTRRLIGIDVTPRYTGQMVWRAIVPRPSWATRLFTFAGESDNCGLVPISEEHAYCFVTEKNETESIVPEDELASRMRGFLREFGGLVAEVRQSILQNDDVVRRPVRTVFVEDPWFVDRVALLGDAAHTPSPQLVSGATLAIEDAIVLAEELSTHRSVESAFDAFDDRRRERARLVVESSIEIGRLEQLGRTSDTYPITGRSHALLAAPI